MLRYSLLTAVCLTVASSAHASWADGLFDELNRDFGSVPRGQMLTHYFRIANTTNAPVRISNVRVSCGCTTARVLQSTLAPGQETAVLAQMDTRRFYNTKNVTIFVTFDQPRSDEVRLWVQANSRDDVSFNPDSINFGRVKRGGEPESKAVITFLGNLQTQVTEVKSESAFVIAEIKEVQRQGGEVRYELSTRLRADTPPGKWFTDVWLKTNNAAMPKLRVPVSVEVESALSVSPTTVSLGQLKAGTETDRKVIIRGVRPFRILNITGTDGQVRVRETANDSKAVHVLTVTLSPAEVGEMTRIIRIETDMATGGDIEFNAQAMVVP